LLATHQICQPVHILLLGILLLSSLAVVVVNVLVDVLQLWLDPRIQAR